MTEYTMNTVDVDDLEEGMTLGEDVFNEVGLRLLTADTVLTEKNLMKLRMYDVDYVLIKEPVDIEYTKRKNHSNEQNDKGIQSKSIAKVETFKAFQASYTDHVEVLHNTITDISEGREVDISDLFSISSDMIGILDTKRDIFGFLHNLKETDDYTYTHSVNVSLLCNVFGQWLGYEGETLKNLTVGGLLHDVGKTKIDPEILNKPGKLTPEEKEEINKHPIYGFRMVEHQDIPQDIKMAILMHHEKSDGSGYPMGAKDQQINEMAKILSIADIYDAMTSKRSYRNKYCPFTVIEELEKSCYGKLDTKFLLVFLKNIAYNYLNCWVRLSSGEEGEIVFINKNDLSRPIVRVDNAMIDLREEKQLYIEAII